MRRVLPIGGVTIVLVGALAAPLPAAARQQSPAAARNVRLCQGAVITPCESAVASPALGAEHEVTAGVTDAAGAPVPEVPVELRLEGAGRFATAGDSIVVATDAHGVATVAVVADDAGRSDVFAEISPVGTPGGFRGPLPDDDECEQPADADGDPGPGNCVAGPLGVDWKAPPSPPDCADGEDNDDDELVDLEDPGCDGAEDDDETPQPVPADRRHRRTISLKFVDPRAPGDPLVVWGRLRLARDGDGGRGCTRGQRVDVQRRVDGRWVTLRVARTNVRGRYEVSLGDHAGRYRAVGRLGYFSGGDVWHVCRRAGKQKPHRHRA